MLLQVARTNCNRTKVVVVLLVNGVACGVACAPKSRSHLWLFVLVVMQTLVPISVGNCGSGYYYNVVVCCMFVVRCFSVAVATTINFIEAVDIYELM